MNDSTFRDIQTAFEEGRPIQITKRKVHLFLHDTVNDHDYLARAIEWLKQSLTDNVHSVNLQMICGYNGSDEQKLFDLAKSKKNLEIYVEQLTYIENSHEACVIIAFKKRKSQTIISAIYHNPADSELFEDLIPKEIPDILTNHGAIKMSTEHLFGDITIEKDSPTSPVTITGIQFGYRISEASEEYLEFVSKIPTLYSLEYDLNLGDKMDKFIELLKVNAYNLREIHFIGPYRGFKESIISRVNDIIIQIKTLETLVIIRNAPEYVIQLEALAENSNIKRLILRNAYNFNDFMEPLRRNKTINDVSIDFTINYLNSIISSATELMQILAEKTCLRRLAIEIKFGRHCECAEEKYDELILTALTNTNITSLCLFGASFADKYDHVTQGRRSCSCSVERCGRVSARSRSRSRSIERSRRSRSKSESRSRSVSRSSSNDRGRYGRRVDHDVRSRSRSRSTDIRRSRSTSLERPSSRRGRRSRSPYRSRSNSRGRDVISRSRSRSRIRSRSISRERHSPSRERPIRSRGESRSRSTSRSRSNSRGRKRNRSNSPSEGRETKRQKISDNSGGDNSGQKNKSSGKTRIIQLLLANPHLTSVEVDNEDGDIPLVLQHHLDENKQKRDETRIGLITLMYNIARSKSDSILPQEVWCHIVSFIAYPGIDQPFNQILRELFKNNAIRRVIKE